MVEPVAVAALPVSSWPSLESASGFSSRSASVTETTTITPQYLLCRSPCGDGWSLRSAGADRILLNPHNR
ncbi:MAG: hypothetical protein LBB58_04000 [Cellulomonadaceae bacterium]|nr:hypothetical protein [Cellulomonadaceae bacterium]